MDPLTALADPTRRRIVEMLAARPMASGDIAGRFDVSASAISQHLKVLRNARLVRVRTAAQRRIYALDDQGLDELDLWLEKVRRFWAVRLDALDARLNEEATKHG